MEITLPEGKTYEDLKRAHEEGSDTQGMTEEQLYPESTAREDSQRAYHEEISGAKSLADVGRFVSRFEGFPGKQSEFRDRAGEEADMANLREITHEVRETLAHNDVLRHPENYGPQEKDKALVQARLLLITKPETSPSQTELLRAGLDLMAKGDHDATSLLLGPIETSVTDRPHEGTTRIASEYLRALIENPAAQSHNRIRAMDLLRFNFNDPISGPETAALFERVLSAPVPEDETQRDLDTSLKRKALYLVSDTLSFTQPKDYQIELMRKGLEIMAQGNADAARTLIHTIEYLVTDEPENPTTRIVVEYLPALVENPNAKSYDRLHAIDILRNDFDNPKSGPAIAETFSRILTAPQPDDEEARRVDTEMKKKVITAVQVVLMSEGEPPSWQLVFLRSALDRVSAGDKFVNSFILNGIEHMVLNYPDAVTTRYAAQALPKLIENNEATTYDRSHAIDILRSGYSNPIIGPDATPLFQKLITQPQAETDEPGDYGFELKSKALYVANDVLANDEAPTYQLDLAQRALDLVAHDEPTATLILLGRMEFMVRQHPAGIIAQLSRKVFRDVLEERTVNHTISAMPRTRLMQLAYNI